MSFGSRGISVCASPDALSPSGTKEERPDDAFSVKPFISFLFAAVGIARTPVRQYTNLEWGKPAFCNQRVLPFNSTHRIRISITMLILSHVNVIPNFPGFDGKTRSGRMGHFTGVLGLITMLGLAYLFSTN